MKIKDLKFQTPFTKDSFFSGLTIGGVKGLKEERKPLGTWTLYLKPYKAIDVTHKSVAEREALIEAGKQLKLDPHIEQEVQITNVINEAIMEMPVAQMLVENGYKSCYRLNALSSESRAQVDAIYNRLLGYVQGLYA